MRDKGRWMRLRNVSRVLHPKQGSVQEEHVLRGNENADGYDVGGEAVFVLTFFVWSYRSSCLVSRIQLPGDVGGW